jgi:hypothetical protein
MDPWFNCPRRQRLGGLGNNGPKYTCDPDRLSTLIQRREDQHPEKSHPLCLVYSFVRGDMNSFAWEGALATLLVTRSCEIHIFDSIESSGKFQWTNDGLIHFHSWRLKGTADDLGAEPSLTASSSNEALTFDEIQHRLGHKNRTIDILKIDCGGCEWCVQPNVSADMWILK